MLKISQFVTIEVRKNVLFSAESCCKMQIVLHVFVFFSIWGIFMFVYFYNPIKVYVFVKFVGVKATQNLNYVIATPIKHIK